ncbi:MAG: NAD(P)-dependent oxidoreductase, partial [Planctomycetota bacterium]
TIAITGGTGFIGRYIVNRLTAAGDSCRGWYRPSSDRTGFTHPSQIDWVEGNLDLPDSLGPLVEGCEAVVHAALFRHGTSFRGGEGPLDAFLETNLIGTIRLIEAARAAGVPKFVFLSTCAVHEEILDDRPLDETHPLWPRTHYGAHKAAIEKFVHSFGLGMGYDICALRPSGVYGLAQPPDHSKWSELIRQVKRGETVTCTGGGKEVHAADVAQAVQCLLNAKGTQGQSYSCCDRYVSQFEVATLAKEITNSPSEILGEPKQPKHQIVTDKLEALGMKFGGTERLSETVSQLVEAL